MQRTQKMSVGGPFPLHISSEPQLCGRAFAIMALDSDNSIQEPIETLGHQALQETTVICSHGGLSLGAVIGLLKHLDSLHNVSQQWTLVQPQVRSR